MVHETSSPHCRSSHPFFGKDNAVTENEFAENGFQNGYVRVLARQLNKLSTESPSFTEAQLDERKKKIQPLNGSDEFKALVAKFNRSSLEIESKPSLEIESKPSLEAESTPSLETESTPSLEAESTPSLEAESTPSLEAESTPSLEVESNSSLELEINSSLEIESNLSLETESHQQRSTKEIVRFLQMFLSISKEDILQSAANSLFELFCGACSLGCSIEIDSFLGKNDVFDIVLNMINVFVDHRNNKCLARLVLANLAFLVKVSSVAFTFFDKKLTKGVAMERYPVWHGIEGIKWEEFYFYSFDECPSLKQFYIHLFDPEVFNLGTSMLSILMDKIEASAKMEVSAKIVGIFYDKVIHVTKYEFIKRLRVKLGENYEIKCNEYINSYNPNGSIDKKFKELKLIDMTKVQSEENDTIFHTISLLRERKI